MTWIQFVGQFRAKRAAKKMKEMDAQRKDMFDRLSRIRPSTLCRMSAACRRFMDEHCPDLDVRACADALQMLVLKRFSLETSSGRSLKDHVRHFADYALLGPSDEASRHPHVLASRLVFSFSFDLSLERREFWIPRRRGPSLSTCLTTNPPGV